MNFILARRALCARLMLFFFLFGNSSAFAAESPLPVNLDLSSTARTQSAQQAPSFQNANIIVGGQTRTVNQSSPLTPAELTALTQVLQTGQQSLALSSLGMAVGGRMTFDSSQLSSLVVPNGVTAVAHFNQSAAKEVLGNITNGGTLFAVSTNPQINSVSFSASNIFNGSGATITSVLPAGGLAGFANALPRLDLSLYALNKIVNSGTISSSGNLNLNAAEIRGTGGTFSAHNGNINIGTMDVATARSITLAGGDYFSKELNIYAPGKTIEANVGNVTGTLNTQANIEHFTTGSQNLTLGTNCVNGDPTFVNNIAGGSITITGTNTFNQAVAILANGEIKMDTGAKIVAHGSDVTIIAGGRITTSGTTTSTVPGAAANQSVLVELDPAKSVGGDINFADGAAVVIDTSQDSQSQGPGGNVILMAVQGTAAGPHGGNVLLGTNSIDTRALGLASGARNGGNVTIIAGATPTSKTATITVGSINTGGSLAFNGNSVSSSGGNVYISTETPKSPNVENAIGFNTQGQIVGTGKAVGNGVVAKNATVQINGDINTSGASGVVNNLIAYGGTNAGAITVKTGSDISSKGLFAIGTGGAGIPDGHDAWNANNNGGDGGSGAAILVSSSNGDINIVGNINTSGGGGGGGVGSNQGTQDGNLPGGKGGIGAAINITAPGGNLAITGSLFAADGGKGGDGGNSQLGLQGGGGGGGGSFGGGGGGGADNQGAGGGGGGGVFGGGGAGHTGGGGGSLTAGGNAANPAQPGSADHGGNGAGLGGNAGAGGALGQGGGGAFGAQFNAPGQAGSPAILNKNITLLAGKEFSLSGSFFGGTVSIKGASGSLGTDTTPLSFSATSLSVLLGSGNTTSNVYLTTAGGVTITSALANNGTFQLQAGQGVTGTTSPIVATTVDLTASGGSINVLTETLNLKTSSVDGATSVTNTGPVTIISGFAASDYTLNDKSGPTAAKPAQVLLEGDVTSQSGSISISLSGSFGTNMGVTPTGLTGGKLSAGNNIAITTGSGVIGTPAGDPLTIEVGNILTIQSASSVFLRSIGSVTLASSKAGPGQVAGSAAFYLTTTPDADGNGRILTNGITVAGSTGAPSLIVLQSSQSGTGQFGGIGALGGTLNAGRILLKDGPNGDQTFGIGTAAAPIATQTGELQLSTHGSAYIKNTGNVVFGGPVALAPASTFGLQSTGSIGNFNNNVVTAGTVVLVSGSSIGTSDNPVLLDSANATITAATSAFVQDNSAGPVNIQTATLYGKSRVSGAPGTFSFIAPNSSSLSNQQALQGLNVVLKGKFVNVLNPITVGNFITLGATDAGNLSINKPISGINIGLEVGSGTIVQLAEGAIKATNQLAIAITDGGTANLQAAKNAFALFVDNVVGNGQVLLSNTVPSTVSFVVGNTQLLNYKYTTSVTTSQPFTADQLSLVPLAGGNNGITINKTITVNSPAILTATGTGGLISAGLAGTGNKTLTADSGGISLTGALTGNQVTLTTNGGNINQTKSAPVAASGGLIVNLNKGGIADLAQATGNFAVFTDTVVGTGTVNVATSSSVTLQSITGNGQNLSVTSGDTIVTPTPIQATSLKLVAQGAGGIGNPTGRATTNAKTVQFIDTATGANIYAELTNTGTVELKASSAQSIFDLKAAGSVALSGQVSAGQALFDVDKEITTTSFFKLPKFGGAIFAPIINLKTTSGDIDAFGNSALPISGSNLTFASGGTLLVNNTVKTGPVILNDSTAVGAFRFATNGQLTVNDVTSNGSIRLQNTDAAGTIFVTANSAIKAGNATANVGNVSIWVGSTFSQRAGTTPQNVTANPTNGGKIFFGTKGITGVSPTNTVNANARNVTFDTVGTATSIQLGGGVTITATNVPQLVATNSQPKTFVLSPANAQTIHTKFAQVDLDAGSLVILLVTTGGVTVYDLDDLHGGSVKVTTKGRSFVLRPGKCVTIAGNQRYTGEQANSCESITYRRVTAHTLPEGMYAFSAEFSALSAIQSVTELKQVLHGNSREVRRMRDHFYKTIAAAAQTGRSSSVPFTRVKYMVAPSMAMISPSGSISMVP